MAGARKDGQERTAASAAGPFAWPQGADPADPFGMGEWMKNLSNAGLPSVGLHPLMAHPAAAVAAATALGFGLSSHIAGMMFGAMQGAASTLQKSVAAPDQAEVSKPAPVARPPKGGAGAESSGLRGRDAQIAQARQAGCGTGGKPRKRRPEAYLRHRPQARAGAERQGHFPLRRHRRPEQGRRGATG